VSHPLEPLMALQKKDRKLIKLMRELRDIPKRKEDIEAQLDGARKKLETAMESKRHTEALIKEVELEIEALKEKTSKYKQQQMEAKTNEQYRAFVREIGTAEEEIKLLEDREMQLMEELEQGKGIVAECEGRLEEERGEISEELDELDERAAAIGERLGRLKEDRRRAASGCDKALLQRYTRILQNKKDFAIVPVEEGGHCGGCHMKLPPQVVHDARNPQKVAACNFCGRIVYNSPN